MDLEFLFAHSFTQHLRPLPGAGYGTIIRTTQSIELLPRGTPKASPCAWLCFFSEPLRHFPRRRQAPSGGSERGAEPIEPLLDVSVFDGERRKQP